MLGISNLHYQGAKGHIYSTCTEHKYAGNPLTDGENTIYNIHLTILRGFWFSTLAIDSPFLCTILYREGY
jgi:hypothetical protein